MIPILLYIVGAIFVLVGAAGLVSPQFVVDPVGITLPDTSARAEIRAVYGGMCLGIGVFLIAAGRRAALHEAGLVLSALMLWGLVVGRVLNLAIEGRPNRVIWIYFAVELAGALASTALLARRRSNALAAAP